MAALFMQISVRFLLMCLTPGTNVADEDASIFMFLASAVYWPFTPKLLGKARNILPGLYYCSCVLSWI